MADLNGDHSLDAVIGPAMVALNDGHGAYQYAAVFFNPVDGSLPVQRVTVADVEGDGDLDVLGIGIPGLAVFRNNGAAVFGGSTTFSLGASRIPVQIAAADVDADTDADAILVYETDGGPQGFIVALNDGTGAYSFGNGYSLNSARINALIIAELNDDGLPDVVVALGNTTEDVRVYLNSPTGMFIGPIGSANPGLSVGLAAADLNGDTLLDLVTINEGTPDTMTIRLNRGNAPGGGWLGFASPASQDVGNAITGHGVDIVTADFDRDGDLDVAFPAFPGGGSWVVSVRTNAGNGTFPFLPVQVPASPAPVLAAGDVLGDDDVDMVVFSPMSGSSGVVFPRLEVLRSHETIT